MSFEAACDRCLPNTCCGCCDKRIGVIIVSILSLIFSIASVAVYAVVRSSSLYGWSVFWLLVVIIFQIVGLFGAYKNNVKLARVYGYWGFINLIVTVFVVVAAPIVMSPLIQEECLEQTEIDPNICNQVKSHSVTAAAVLGVLELFIDGYLTLVSWSYYRSLLKGGYDTELGTMRQSNIE